MRAKELRLTVGNDKMIIVTHKYKEMYECFRIAFELLSKNVED